MFNNNIKTNTINVNACSGGIYKTYLESWFQRFHLQSQSAKELLTNDRYGNNIDKIILQMIICGDMEVIAEIIKKEDLEKYLTK